MAARSALVLGSDGLPQQQQTSDVQNLGALTVASLPTLTSAARAMAFATNGRALTGVSLLGIGGLLFENSGAGTGCLVTWNGTAWKVAGTATTVTA